MGGLGSGLANDADEVRTHGRARPGRQPGARGAGRGVRARLEGVRARADARPQRQRGGRLLDRERRPDGRAHRRLDHRRAGDDAHRPRVPAHARRGHRGAARGRRGHRRLQHPVRDRPGDRPADRDRDEPAGVALVGAGVQGDRLPDRQDRGQARGRLHPGRDPQRHHAQDAGRLRADPGLRRGQGAAVRLREVPGRRPGADDAHEERRRGDVDRAQLHRGARQGAALDGDQGGRVLDAARTPTATTRRSCCARAAVPTDGRLYTVEQALRAGAASTRSPRRPASTRGSSTRSRSSSSCGAELRRRADAGRGPAAHARSGTACPTGRSPRCGRNWPARTGCALLRHRLGIRPVYKTVDTCAAEFDASDAVPLLDLRRGDRGRAAARPAEGDHPRQRAEPDRPGHRVRLLVRARGHGAARRRATRP